MRIIKIEKTSENAHLWQSADVELEIPYGWAVIPDDMETPNLPYGDIVVEEIEGVTTVTSWTPRELPVVEPTPEVKAEPTADELIDILLGVNTNE